MHNKADRLGRRRNMEMWYEQPAKNWEEALPVGNGRLGAMIAGSPKQEIIWLNEPSGWLWQSSNLQENFWHITFL